MDTRGASAVHPRTSFKGSASDRRQQCQSPYEMPRPWLFPKTQKNSSISFGVYSAFAL